MEEKLHLPWDDKTLKDLLIEIIKRGETTKIDFKQELNIDITKEKAEFLKDVSAIANTFDPNYYNYGFILVGVKQNEIVGSSFLQNKKVDNLQATVDEIIKVYLSPFIKTHLTIFEENEKTWGVIVIPPTRMLPHVFIRDIDNKSRGDVYIRKGTITEKALPEDYSRFFSVYIDEIRYDFRRQIDDIRSELDEVKRHLDKMVQPKEEAAVESKSEVHRKPEKKNGILQKRKNLNLLQEIDNVFILKEDPIERELIKEAHTIRTFLESDAINWCLQIPSKEEGKELFDSINKKAEIYWQSLSKILLKDDEGKYNEAIIKSIEHLSHYYEPPIGITYTYFGQYIHYYPLIVILYIIFAVGTFKKRDSILKRISELELTRKSYYEEPFSIAYSLFFIRRAEKIFQTQHEQYPQSKWCDPVASYIKSLFDQKIHIEDYLWDPYVYFFIGEFLLSLLPLDIVDKNTGRKIFNHPSSGLYMYISDSVPIIKKFLTRERDWIRKIFHRPLEEILKEFDETPKKLERGGCWAEGFVSGAFETVFPEKAKIEKVKKF